MFLSVATLFLKDSKLEIINCSINAFSIHKAHVVTTTVRKTQRHLSIYVGGPKIPGIFKTLFKIFVQV